MKTYFWNGWSTRLTSMLFFFFTLSGILSFTSCNDQPASDSEENVWIYVPKAPDYSDPTFWYTREADSTGTGADVFYLVSTWETEWKTADGALCRYADVYNEQHRADMTKEISRIADYMGIGNNFYSPFYRHMAIDTWATRNEDTINYRFQLPMSDVLDAFNRFLQQRDPERPFILAGFSQGGKCVVELLKAMPEELHPYLVAAYVLGYKVTPDDLRATTNIQGAQDSTDIGVTICYNSVSDVRYIQPVVAEPCAICINPVNWRTDATPATLHDTITVTVSPEHHVLVLQGYSGDEYQPIRDFLNVGDFHSCEPWLYQDCLKQNIQTRIREYYRKAKNEVRR